MAEARSSKVGLYAELRTAKDAICSAAGIYVELSAAQVRSSLAGAYIELKSANAYSSAAGLYSEVMEAKGGPTRRSLVIFNGYLLPLVGWSYEAKTREFDATKLTSDAIERGATVSDWSVEGRGHWSPELDAVLGTQVAGDQEANNSLMWIVGHRNREVVYSTHKSFVTLYRQANDLDIAMPYEVRFAISGLVERVSL